jgi:hypothetical protein
MRGPLLALASTLVVLIAGVAGNWLAISGGLICAVAAFWLAIDDEVQRLVEEHNEIVRILEREERRHDDR